MAEYTEEQQLLDAEIGRAAAFMTTGQNIVFFTGAGASEESGIPTFRGNSGLWQRFPPETYGTLRGLSWVAAITPWNLAAFMREILGSFVQAEPNACHRAIADFQKNSGMKTINVITQNVDNLHQQAGANPDRVLELHGSLLKWSCLWCLTEHEFTKHQLVENTRELLKDGWVVMRMLAGKCLLRCEQCNGVMRPDVVLFGEQLSTLVLEHAKRVCMNANCVVVVGTSGRVQPASLLPEYAKEKNNATIIEINPKKEFERSDVWLRGTATEVLPALIAATRTRTGMFDMAIELNERRQQKTSKIVDEQ